MCRVAQVVRRHDLHTVFVEHVLDVRVQLVDDLGSATWHAAVALGAQAVLDIEVGQGRLDHVGGRFGCHAGRTPGRLQQHRVHLPPGRGIADGDRGVQHEVAVGGQARVVAHRLAEDHCIGQAHLFAQPGVELEREHAHGGHRAFGFTDLHVFALAQRARVHQAQAGHDLPHDTGSSQRQHQAGQHRNTLESLAAGAGQKGVGHGQREQPDHRVAHAPRGACRIAVQPADDQVATLHALHEGRMSLREQPGDEEDQGGGQQTRHGSRGSAGELRQQTQPPVGGPLGPGTGVGELPQRIGEAQVGQQHQHCPAAQRQRAACGRVAVLPERCRQLVAGLSSLPLLMAGLHPAEDTSPERQRGPGRCGTGQCGSCSLQHAQGQALRIGPLAHFGDRLLQTLTHALGRLGELFGGAVMRQVQVGRP
jgi:hypothetical protein